MMKYNNMSVSEVLNDFGEEQRREAQKYLDSKKVLSAKSFSDGVNSVFEAFIVERGKTIYMPFVELSNNHKVSDIHCQCCDDEKICVHKLALLLAAQAMMEAAFCDYHMAQKILMAKMLSRIMVAKSGN